MLRDIPIGNAVVALRNSVLYRFDRYSLKQLCPVNICVSRRNPSCSLSTHSSRIDGLNDSVGKFRVREVFPPVEDSKFHLFPFGVHGAWRWGPPAHARFIDRSDESARQVSWKIPTRIVNAECSKIL